MKELIFESPYDEQKLRKMVSCRCKRRKTIANEDGIYYYENDKYFYLEPISSNQRRLKRLLRCRTEKDGDKTLVKCRFVLPRVPIIILFSIMLCGNIKWFFGDWMSKIFGIGLFIAFASTLAIAMSFGTAFFSKEEIETIEFLKERITKNNSKEE